MPIEGAHRGQYLLRLLSRWELQRDVVVDCTTQRPDSHIPTGEAESSGTTTRVTHRGRCCCIDGSAPGGRFLLVQYGSQLRLVLVKHVRSNPG